MIDEKCRIELCPCLNYIISYYCIRTKKRKTEKEKESIVEKEEKKVF
jgi:hypothetical protein